MKNMIGLLLFAVLFVMGCGSETTVVVDGDGDAASQADGDADTTLDGDSAGDDDSDTSDAADGDAETAEQDTDSLTCASDNCAIDGVCYADKAASPTSSCRRCEVTTSRTAWTNVAYGTACNDGNACTKNDACDGQGTCQGEADSACQADGDADYDTDIDPDEVVIGASCPEDGINICVHQVVVQCSHSVWGVGVNCTPDPTYNACWDGKCVDPKTEPGYPGCNVGDTRCETAEGDAFISECQLRGSSHEWVAIDGCNVCCFGQCTKTCSY